jgi:hypothetical protein
MKTTPHNHTPNFGRRVPGCPRCTELNVGMPAVTWNRAKAEAEAQQIRAIRSHVCTPAKCGPCCTFGQW